MTKYIELDGPHYPRRRWHHTLAKRALRTLLVAAVLVALPFMARALSKLAGL